MLRFVYLFNSLWCLFVCRLWQVPNPEFEGQTKTRLGNPEVRKVVEGVVGAGG